MSVNPVFPVVFNGGQMTDLPAFTGTLNGQEMMEIVAAPLNASLAAEGVNYSITTQLLASLINYLITTPVIIAQGEHATIGTPYIVQPADSRIYIDKPVAEATYLLMPDASTMFVEPLVRDIAGTAGSGVGITVSFTGGQLADGLATIPIETPYGGYFFRPVATLSKWTLGVG